MGEKKKTAQKRETDPPGENRAQIEKTATAVGVPSAMESK